MKNINYIGSTTDIKYRAHRHKSNCYNKNSKNYNMFLYRCIREKKINIELEILFCYKKKCSFKIQRLVEQYYINKHDSVNNGLNMQNAFTNRIKASREYAKEYRKNNPKKYKEYKKNNPNKYKKYNKKYREKNREIINQKQRTKINCPLCNCLIIKRNLKRHQKGKKCKKITNQILK